METISNIITGQLVHQNSQEFVIGVFTINQILKFTKYTSRLIVGYDDDNLPIYNKEIQRSVENSRVEKIADFLIMDPLATFPTNIVLGIPSVVIDEIEIDKNNSNVSIRLNDQVYEELNRSNGNVYITIIDGQHRIRGIEVAIKRLESEIHDLNKTISNCISSNLHLQSECERKTKTLLALQNIELIVSFFIDPSLEYQALIFSTINRTQKRVSQNLVNSLFGLDQNDTPQKTALEITLSLNSHPSSPFYKRILLYGGEYAKNQSPPISQATMVRSIINLICENPREAENDRHRNRKELRNRKDGSVRFLPFRRYYAENKDSLISDVFYYFFQAVQTTFIDRNGYSYWDINDAKNFTNILQTTVGYEALLKILCDILEKTKVTENEFRNKSYFEQLLSPAKKLNFIDQKRYPFSTKGKNILYLEMSLSIFPLDLSDPKDLRLRKLNELIDNNE
jgi:DGQHR domain-containing protein